MTDHTPTGIFFESILIPADALIGEDGKGFEYILTGMKAARRLIAPEAATACIRSHGGFGLTEDDDVGRKSCDIRLCQVAPISTNLILSFTAGHMPGLPRSN
ncbi:hypothetical protein [Falsigemmobacter faecalis]|uniref:Acyl-CoA dehydrogenase/oxidase C-terminal domain-containing protein n=1 Tax=Falsigemmobacter faecalis TaxID=2488730 RepID=A0A3P3DPJ1_9RHOB|nr:hypothetical protein [Falsigemmobacter faecalis]RRH76187.1 hypothetical protein EG244_07155 [Falsigemmobacter faecalis]